METVSKIEDLEVLEVSRVDEPANLRKFAIFKKKEEEMAEQDTLKGKALADPPKGTKKEEMEEEEEEDMEMKKELEAIAKEREDLAKALEEQKAQLEAVNKRLQEEQDAKLEVEFVTKAKEQFSKVPAEAEELGKLLKDLHAANPEAAEKVEQILAAMQGAITEGEILKEVGTAGEPQPESAHDKLAKIAKQLQTDEPSLSEAQAYSKALTLNPKLYEESLAE